MTQIQPHEASNENPTGENASRREFLIRGAAAGLAVGALGALGGTARAQEPTQAVQRRVDLFRGAVNEQGEYVLPPLPYDYAALEPHIDAETMKLHHDTHHAAYVKGLIEANQKIDQARESGDFATLEYHIAKASFNGAGHFLHCVFWDSMAPETGEPLEDLAQAITATFGSREKLMDQFNAAAKAVEGSGWGILAWSMPARRLVVTQARNHNLLSDWSEIPLLVVDVWEHAYYKKFGPKRADYIAAFNKVINWKGVSQRYHILRQLMA